LSLLASGVAVAGAGGWGAVLAQGNLILGAPLHKLADVRGAPSTCQDLFAD
jgi:hypothetical protein